MAMTYVPFSTLDDDALRSLQANTESGSQMRAIGLELESRAFKASFEKDPENRSAALVMPKSIGQRSASRLIKRAVWEALRDGDTLSLLVHCDPAPKGKVNATKEARIGLTESVIGTMHKDRVQARIRKVHAGAKNASCIVVEFRR